MSLQRARDSPSHPSMYVILFISRQLCMWHFYRIIIHKNKVQTMVVRAASKRPALWQFKNRLSVNLWKEQGLLIAIQLLLFCR
ncbi:hypothetical protein FKM82_001595 [Ascaphus truei]